MNDEAPLAASELDRSARPSKFVIRAANEHRRCARRRDAFFAPMQFYSGVNTIREMPCALSIHTAGL